MEQATNHATTEPSGPVTANGTSVTGKVSLIEMIMAAEAEADKLETWTRMTVDPEARIWMARRTFVARKIVQTLDLLRDHEQEFVEIIKTKREVDARKARKK